MGVEPKAELEHGTVDCNYETLNFHCPRRNVAGNCGVVQALLPLACIILIGVLAPRYVPTPGESAGWAVSNGGQPNQVFTWLTCRRASVAPKPDSY